MVARGLLPLVVGSLLFTGCDDGGGRGSSKPEGLPGQWSSSETVAGQYNRLSVDAEGAVTTTLHILYQEDGQSLAGRFDFDGEWLQVDDDYRFDLACERTPLGECDGNDDFEMECEFDGDDSLICSGDSNWSEYVFRWARGAKGQGFGALGESQ